MFTEMDGDWFIQVFRRDLGRFGNYGELPKIELVQFGESNFGIKLVESTTNQGET